MVRVRQQLGASELREGVEVLRGDPHRVAAVADALAFEHKYTSGVIAWAPDDTPTDAQIGAVIDAFEQTAWAGLEPDRYAWAAVVHRERDGGVHVHVLAARCDLETGRTCRVDQQADLAIENSLEAPRVILGGNDNYDPAGLGQ